MAEATTKQAKFAFQCKNCGAVEPAEAAGENEVPSACHVCRHGVSYEVHPDGTGFDKVYAPDNWIKLAELKPEELAKDFHRHGLKPEHVVAHKPKNTGPPPAGQSVVRAAVETVGSKDKAST